jgi:tetratricopeptide (TPR) repeat protein
VFLRKNLAKNSSALNANLSQMGLTSAENEFSIGREFLTKRDPGNATIHFRSASDAEPHVLEYKFWLGRSLYREKKFVEAEKALRDVLCLDPLYIKALRLLGRCAEAVGNVSSAEEYYKLVKDVLSKKVTYRSQGKFWYHKKRFVEAEACFRGAVLLSPNDAGHHHWLGRSLHRQGRYREGEVRFREAVRLNSGDELNHQWLGTSLYNQDRFVEAEACLREAILLNPNNAGNHYWLGCSLSGQERYRDAEVRFREAVRLNPGDVFSHHWLGTSLYNQGCFVEAEACLREAVLLNPNNAGHHYWLGRSLSVQGLYSQAELHFQEATRLNPENSSVHWSSSRSLPDENLLVSQSWISPENEITSGSSNQYETGKLLHSQGHFIDAEVCFREAVRLNPNDVGSHHWLGRALSDQLRFVDAEVCFREALRLNPNDAANNWWLGTSLHTQGRFTAAEVYFREAVRLNPNDAGNHHWLGNSLYNQGSFVDATTCFREAVRLDINNELNHFWLGYSLFKQGRFVDADVCFREAVRLNANNEFNHFWLGTSLYNQERFIDAEKCFREAVRLNVNNEFNHHWLGASLYNQGLFLPAEACLRDAILLNPNNAGNHYWLGRSLAGQERNRDADVCFREAVRLDPENAIYSQCLEGSQLPDSLVPAESVSEDDSPKSFVEFLLQGQFWLENSSWNVAGKSSFLQGLYEANFSWADPTSVLFDDYEVNDEFLNESLARAELLSKSLHLQPSMPTFLETSELTIAMTIEGSFLRAWVGKNQIGVAVAVNLSTWELHYPLGDIDGAFAVGAALNWFLDRSFAHQDHPHFRGHEGSTWKVSTGFYDDISKISSGVYPQPMKIHQVRGFKRTLVKGTPTDKSRDNAPAYIKPHMAPNETWVKTHKRGEGESGKKLVTRLTKSSNLADFLATAPRA